MTIKQIATVLTALFALLGAAWGLNKQFTPREVTEMMVADVQQNQMILNKTGQRQNALNWLSYWQIKVTRLTGECAVAPNNMFKKNELKEAIKQRDIWQIEVNRLMQQ